MKSIALLSCDSLEGHIIDDHLLVKELSSSYQVSNVSWTERKNWSLFDAVIIRTTWDYMKRPAEFLDVLRNIQLSGTKLFNSLSVVTWNIHKFYLKELQAAGILIVPTVFLTEGQKVQIPSQWDSDHFVLKPAISAGAYNTVVLSRQEALGQAVSGEWLLQPFLPAISEGEISLIFFDKKFSHGLMKIPQSGEFRVQEEFGGKVVPYNPDQSLLNLAHDILAQIDLPLLYARVDLIAFNGAHALMELELIEPALYFRTHPEAAANFHGALKNYLEAGDQGP